MRKRTKDFFRQFMRNDRWGTCGYCPRDSEGNVYPEFCAETNRYDHQLTLNSLCEMAKQREIEEDLQTATNTGSPKLLALVDKAEVALCNNMRRDCWDAVRELREQLRAGD